MFHLEAVGVQNLRGVSLHDAIPLKRITILVGKNSAGKSTVARVFPLLRQTVQTSRKSPVLWFGHLSDFGSFDDAVNRNKRQDPITFRFKFRTPKRSELSQAHPKAQFSDPRRLRISNNVAIDISISVSRNDEGTYISKCSLVVGDHEIEIEINPKGSVSVFRFGKQEYRPEKDFDCFSVEGHIVPELVFIRNIGDEKKPRFEIVERPFFDLVKRYLSPLLHGNTREQTYISIANSLPIGSTDLLLESLVKELNRRGLKHSLNNRTRHPLIPALGNSICLFRLREIFRTIESDLTEYFSGVRYLAPLRATAQRYYRQQELSVDEIDPQGSNLANVLSSIPSWERRHLEDWMEEHLKFKVETTPSSGHISLLISQTGSQKKTNLADMGFGFSQILPIPIQLWLSSQETVHRNFRSKVRPTTCIVVEQPELHLHPAFQSRLADLFLASGEIADAASPNMIIETHSQALVNRFGELIHQGRLNPDDIQVLLFEVPPDREEPTIRATTYNQEGFLNDWPYGFFEPDFE